MRQFISTENPDKNGLILITQKDYRYFRQVLRVKSGDMISVRIPAGDLVNTTVCKIDEKRKELTLQLCSTLSDSSITRGVQAEDLQSDFGFSPELWLFAFISKPVKMELIIRQAVECGVKYIVPVIGEYSQKSSIQALESSKQERILRIVKEARQQSGSPVETEVKKPCSVEEACSLWKEQNSKGIVLWERSEKCETLHKIFSSADINKVAVAVGCEGGISPEEIERLMNSNFVPVHFDINILRAETASLYGLAAVQSVILEKSKWQCTE